MTKYDYTDKFEVSGGKSGNDLPTTKAKSLEEALSHLATINNGVLITTVYAPKDDNMVKLTVKVKYEDTVGKSERQIYELFDRNVAAQLENIKSDAFDPWLIDGNKIFPRA